MTEAPTRYEGWNRDRQGWFMGQTAGTWITGAATGLPLLLGVGAAPLAVRGWRGCRCGRR